MNLFALVLLSCGCLCGLGTSALFVMQLQSRQERLRTRFASILEASGRPQTLMPRPLVLAMARATDRTFSTRLLGLFNIDRTRTAHMPVRWYMLLVCALVVARGLTAVAELVVGSWGLLLWPGLWVLVSRFLFGWFAQRHTRALFKQFPDALGTIVRGVRIGIPVSQAVGLIAKDSPMPTAAEFARVSDALLIGKPMDEAMTELAERNGLPEYRFFATALTLQNQTGGGLAATLENLADVIRKRAYTQAKGYALAAEARMSALVLSALPVFTFFILLVINPGYIGLLFVTSTGHELLGLATGLLCTGQFCMRALIRRSLS